MSNDARWRVDDAIWSIPEGEAQAYERADAAIAAHSEWLWERALDPATVEAVAKVIFDFPEWEVRMTEPEHAESRRITTTLLTALLGPRKETDDGRVD